MLSKIDPIKKVARTLRRHQDFIINLSITKRYYSSGIVEAINASAKVTIRNAHGLRRYETMKYALFHKLGQLPVPRDTHELFWRTENIYICVQGWFGASHVRGFL